MVIDDNDKYVIVYIYNRSNPMLQALTQWERNIQFNEKYYIISILQVKKTLLPLGSKDHSTMSKVN